MSLRRSSLSACTCLCQCASTSTASTSSALLASVSSSRAASTSTSSQHHRTRPARGWVLPDFRAAKRGAQLPSPRVHKFENKVSLPNDGSMTIYSTCPRPNITINRDTSNHPLWAFASSSSSSSSATSAGDEDEAGRMGRFARKFGQPQNSEHQRGISEGQARGAELMGVAAGGSEVGGTDAATAAAKQVRKEEVEQPSKGATATATAASGEQEPAPDMFDLTLEGEVFEESKHKVVEEGKKGKKGAGKKGGKK